MGTSSHPEALSASHSSRLFGTHPPESLRLLGLLPPPSASIYLGTLNHSILQEDGLVSGLKALRF